MYHFGFIGNVVALLKLNPNRPLIGRVYWYGDHGRQRQKDNDEVIRHLQRNPQARGSCLREYFNEVLLSGAAGVMSPSFNEGPKRAPIWTRQSNKEGVNVL